MNNEKSGRLQIVQNGTKVILVFNEHTYTEMPYQAAMEVSKAIHRVAKLCEAEDHVEETIKDQELLTGLGIPIQLPSNRHCALAGIPSQQVVGQPTLIVHQP